MPPSPWFALQYGETRRLTTQPKSFSEALVLAHKAFPHLEKSELALATSSVEGFGVGLIQLTKESWGIVESAELNTLTIVLDENAIRPSPEPQDPVQTTQTTQEHLSRSPARDGQPSGSNRSHDQPRTNNKTPPPPQTGESSQRSDRLSSFGRQLVPSQKRDARQAAARPYPSPGSPRNKARVVTRDVVASSSSSEARADEAPVSNSQDDEDESADSEVRTSQPSKDTPQNPPTVVHFNDIKVENYRLDSLVSAASTHGKFDYEGLKIHADAFLRGKGIGPEKAIVFSRQNRAKYRPLVTEYISLIRSEPNMSETVKILSYLPISRNLLTLDAGLFIFLARRSVQVRDVYLSKRHN